MISVRVRPGTEYPDADDCFSPGEAYPEAPFEPRSGRPNPVYALVRQVLADQGLDEKNFGTPEWNPLGDLIPRGSKVFVLCNFVSEQRPREGRRELHAKCTHGSVLRALLDYVLLATGPEGRVRFGNAPLQSCRFDRVLEETGASRVLDFYRSEGVAVEARDLRLYVAARTLLGRVASETRRDESDGIEVDLGSDSLLAEFAGQGSRFRVSQYDPDRTDAFHAGRSHRYVIHREVLEADVVISLPKLKTHEKVGITTALKGFVGTVGHKDCLAHHRFGSAAVGGDEYPPGLRWLQPASRFHDWTHRDHRPGWVQGLAEITDHTLRRVMRYAGLHVAGAWHGNDTCWRMALDLSRIVHHADREGRMHEATVRKHLVLIDGILAGEGQGPLAPTAVPAGVLVFGDDVAWADRVACRLMGYPLEAVPLIARAFEPGPWALPAAHETETLLHLDGRLVSEAELRPVLGRPFAPPAGWEDQLVAGS